jgi:tetratricopeptide (TPR) repeat protein
MRIGRILLLVVAGLGVFAAGCNAWAYWQYRSGQQASALRDYVQAQERFEKCTNVWFLSSQTYLQAGRAARRAEHFDVAAKHLRRAQSLSPDDATVDLELKLLRAQASDLASVQEELESLLAHDHPQSTEILEVLTPAYLQSDQLNSALKSVDAWLQREPNNLAAWQYRARIFTRLQVAPRILECQRKVLELNPEDDDTRLQYAKALAGSRQALEATKQYEFLQSRLGDTSDILCGLATCLIALNQGNEGGKLLDKVLATQPDNAVALAERGRLAMQQGSPVEAEKWLRRAASERPFEHDILYSLYQCLLKLGKDKQAAEVQAKFKAIEADLLQLREAILQVGAMPHSPEPRYQAGVILLRNGKDGEGLRWLASALAVDPRHAASRRALAEYFSEPAHAREANKYRQLLH